MVITARGWGKTFGLRKQCLKDVDKGYRFVEVVRFANELSAIQAGYFDKLANELSELDGWEFKTEGQKGYRRPKDSKQPWELICYFVALTQMQTTKKQTFVKVKRIIYDEAILDAMDKTHHYLPYEWEMLANVVDSCTRQNASDDDMQPAYLYLLANAVDLINPVFLHFQINDVPKNGYTWFDGKFFLLHKLNDDEYGHAKETRTLAGRMLAGTRAGDLANYNRMELLVDANIKKKPSNARCQFNIRCKGETWGIWYDQQASFYYVSKRCVKQFPIKTYALTLEDGSPDVISLKINKRFLSSFANFVYQGMVFFENAQIKDSFMRAISLYGIR